MGMFSWDATLLLSFCLPFKWSRFLKEKICSYWSKFFPFRVDPIWKGLGIQESKQQVSKVNPLCKKTSAECSVLLTVLCHKTELNQKSRQKFYVNDATNCTRIIYMSTGKTKIAEKYAGKPTHLKQHEKFTLLFHVSWQSGFESQ